MQCDNRASDLSRPRAVSDNSWKYELECLRLAAECTELASDVRDLGLEHHFLQMAKAWTERAELGQREYLN